MTAKTSHATCPHNQLAAASAKPVHGARRVPCTARRARSTPASAHTAAAVHAVLKPRMVASGPHPPASIATTATAAAAAIVTECEKAELISVVLGGTAPT